jgi:hypothetical protein
MALDRNRSAPQVYNSLPEHLRIPPSKEQETFVPITYSGDYFLEIAAAGANKVLELSNSKRKCSDIC